jgi:hypothetical protein
MAAVDFADAMADLMRRYKSAIKGSAAALAKKEGIAAHLAQVDALLAHLEDTRAALARAVAQDSAALLALRSREAVLAAEVQALGARHAGHAGERARAGAALAASGEQQASFLLAAASTLRAAAGANARSVAREATGELRSSRAYSMAVSHRLDPSCTGTLPGCARPAALTHPRTLPRAEGGGGGGGPAFSPMRPRGGSAPKAGGLTILSSKGGGAVGITSAVSQAARITLQDEAALLGYRTVADREYARATAPARETDIRRHATAI